MKALYKKDVYQSHNIIVSETDQKSSRGDFIYHNELENSLKKVLVH